MNIWSKRLPWKDEEPESESLLERARRLAQEPGIEEDKALFDLLAGENELFTKLIEERRRLLRGDSDGGAV